MGGRLLLDADELGAALGTSGSTIERLRSEGLPFFDLTPKATRGAGKRPKRIVRFDPQEVIAWLRSRREAAEREDTAE